jgi:pentatricopeptide repeat protein
LENTSTDKANNPDADVIKEEIGTSDSEEIKNQKKFYFLTRSLVEVYVKQNHLASALEIYRRMLTKDPSDQNLKERIIELENCIAAKRGLKSKESNT